ncbi:MAG: hypothetical protein JNL80_15135 [Phycisphaerae bacterium]|nr:hypothetical protein [Phycisphaerae bacterium]
MAEVAKAVCSLSDLYTLERGLLSRRQGDDAHLLAKTLYFLASDAPKVVMALDECAARDARFALPRNIVDVGCGVGATSVGLLLSLAQRGARAVTITGVDHEPSVLALWAMAVRVAARVVKIDVTLRTFTDDLLTRPLPKETDLVLCQTALNERLPGNRSGELTHDATTLDLVEGWGQAAPTLLIEPALRATTRALQRLRDLLVARGHVDLIAPCPHRQACPMLANERDWCHEARRVPPTPLAAEVQRLTRRRDETSLFSMLAIAPRLPQRGPNDPTDSPHLWRLVSDPLGSRGKTERWVCCGDGRLRQVRVLDRERSDTNALLIEAERGTLVRLPVLPASDRIAPSDVVERTLGG